MRFGVEVAGRMIAISDLCIAKNTFLGAPGDADEKPTYAILTDTRMYMGPDMNECRRMCNEREDKSSIHFAGRATAEVVQLTGNVLAEILGKSVFR